MVAQSEAVRAGFKATAAARKRLLEAHREEYERFLREERESRGLPAEANKSGRKTPEQKLEKQMEKVNQLRAELGLPPLPVVTS